MTAKELAKRFSLETLRDVYDSISTADILFDASVEREIEGVKYVLQPSEVGRAKLLLRGWVK